MDKHESKSCKKRCKSWQAQFIQMNKKAITDELYEIQLEELAQVFYEYFSAQESTSLQEEKQLEVQSG
jgi:hypothetical protein